MKITGSTKRIIKARVQYMIKAVKDGRIDEAYISMVRAEDIIECLLYEDHINVDCYLMMNAAISVIMDYYKVY